MKKKQIKEIALFKTEGNRTTTQCEATRTRNDCGVEAAVARAPRRRAWRPSFEIHGARALRVGLGVFSILVSCCPRAQQKKEARKDDHQEQIVHRGMAVAQLKMHDLIKARVVRECRNSRPENTRKVPCFRGTSSGHEE
jgi:hypothetical protein